MVYRKTKKTTVKDVHGIYLVLDLNFMPDYIIFTTTAYKIVAG